MPINTFLAGGGEMGAITRSVKWADNILGKPDTWPQSLRTTLSILLNSKFPMFLFWGPELICFYNDAYRPSLGNNGKHPAVGMRGQDLWPEIWKDIKPLIDQVLAGGEASWSEDQLLPIYRNGKLEDVYWTFSYSPVYDESGTPEGVFVTCNETTGKVKLIADLQSSYEAQQSLNEEISAINEELLASNEQVVQSHEILRVLNESLTFNERQLQFTIDAAELGTWDLNPFTGRFSGNARLKSWFGLQPDEEIALSVATDNIIDADRLRVVVAIETAMTYGSGGYEIEYTIVNPKNGVNMLVKAKGRAEFDENRKPIRFSGILQDITHEKKITQALEEANQRLEIALAAGKLGSYDLNVATGEMLCTDQFKLNFGRSVDQQMCFQDLLEMVVPQHRDYLVHQVDKAIQNRTVYQAQYQITWPDGSLHWISAAGSPRYSNEGKPDRIIGVTYDITEQKEDDQRKNDFIGMVSHELKTPLTSLKAYVQMLGARAKTNEDGFTVNALGKVETQVNKMSAMINSFLNVSRLESGKIHLEKQDFDLVEALTETLEEFRLINSGQDIKFYSGGPLTVYADEEKIKHVVSNLVSNAIKYSPKNTPIEIKCELVDGMARLSVKDQGIGIKPHDIERLFERYYRVESDTTRHISGFGVGLYLSAEIIQRHNGKIWVESEPDQGSTFYFSLPLN
jgi:two-component system sensor histidine kinase VicK